MCYYLVLHIKLLLRKNRRIYIKIKGKQYTYLILLWITACRHEACCSNLPQVEFRHHLICSCPLRPYAAWVAVGHAVKIREENKENKEENNKSSSVMTPSIVAATFGVCKAEKYEIWSECNHLGQLSSSTAAAHNQLGHLRSSTGVKSCTSIC